MASTNAHHDGYELRVRTDEIKSYRTDRVSANLTYEGRAIVLNADTSEPIWQIKRIIGTGAETYWEWANEGQYTAAWDERMSNASYWPGEILLDNNFSLEFDGINDYLAFPTTAFTALDTGTQWSMSFWIWVDNLGAQRTIYSKTTNDVNVNGLSLQITTGGNFFLQARHATYNLAYTGVAVIAAQTWTHVTLTYNGGTNFNGFRLYKNAVLDNVPGAGAMVASLHSGQVPCFGSRNTAAFFYSGNIDEVSFWTKALSQAEVTELFNLAPSAVPEHSATAFLVHWWRMGDGDVFPTIQDQIDAVDGTMTNMTSSDIVAEVP